MTKGFSSQVFTIVAFIVLLNLYSCNRSNENNNTNKGSSLLKEKKESDESNKVFEYQLPKEIEYNSLAGNFLVDKLFPIGWSRDGKFAYITEPADEAAGLYFFEFVIFDSNSNQVVWSWKPPESEKGDLKSTWGSNYELFKKKLNNNKIIPGKCHLETADLISNGKDYKLKFETKTGMDELGFGFEVVKRWIISLKSKGGASKVIADVSEKNNVIMNASLAGCFKSPYDDKVLTLALFERMGYEGPPNVIFFKLSGGNLK